MKVWIFVEGESDRIALNALWARWKDALRQAGWGIRAISLENKPKYFRKIGPRAAEKLVHDERDCVVGLPDLYPNSEYANTQFRHQDLAELKIVQAGLVRKALADVFDRSERQINSALDRFLPTAFKHDAEMLLLAARDELRAVLGTPDSLGNWRHPVEDQDQVKPPKYVVEELFLSKTRKRYRDTIHARMVLERIADIKKMLFSESGQLQCPVFKEMVDWISVKTGVPAYGD